MEKKKGLHSSSNSSVCHNLELCPVSGCFFCTMKEQNPAKRRAGIAKYFKEMPSKNDEGQVLVMSGLWNIAMTQPDDPEFPKLGILECMAALIRKGVKDRRWLLRDQNVYIPYYAAHIIGSYTMNVEEFAEMAVEAGVIPPLVELLRGRLTWVEQRVAVRALGHLATYSTTFPAVSAHEEIVELGMELSSSCLEIVYTQFIQRPSRRLRYHCDLLTRGMGGTDMENRKAEEWASQLQCWSLHLLNCFGYKDNFVPLICRPAFLKKLPGMWGGLVNENSPAGVGLLRILCYHKVGRSFIADCTAVIDSLCNVARSSDDWQYMAIDCLLLLLQDPHTRSKVGLGVGVELVIEKAVLALVDLAEMESLGDRKRVGETITEVLLKDHSTKRGSSYQLLDELWSLRQRSKWERNMSREDLRVKRAAAMVVKLEGNAKFSSGDLKGAVTKYTEALALCPLKTRKERVILYSNRAQCHLMLQQPDYAISDTTRALSISLPVNSHSKSLWRRAQAFDMKGLAKESLLDAIMFINECSLMLPDAKDKRYVNVPYYAAQMVRKQMHAAWLFADAAQKHGSISCSNGDCSEFGQEEEEIAEEEEEDESEWETVSEGNEEEEKEEEEDAAACPRKHHSNGNGIPNAKGKTQLPHSNGNRHSHSSASSAAAHKPANPSIMMMLPTIKEESVSEEEKAEQIKKLMKSGKEQRQLLKKRTESPAPAKKRPQYKHDS
eukprot:Gb_14655 [translate_table: standard]